ncbi:MAG: YcaO-like family protein [Thiotrichaceae bacterium]|nr:YcaO-like family protein [Thiotrichaceae bacterium]
MMKKTYIKGKDEALEVSIEKMQAQLKSLDFDIEEVLWLNPVSNIYSVNIRDKNCPLLFTNGKGSSKNACLASALGEFFERLNCNYFFADYYLGQSIAQADFVHYPSEQWFSLDDEKDAMGMPKGLLNEELWSFYNPEQQLTPESLIDTNSANTQRGICALPFVRHADQVTTWFPVNIIGNLYVSNGMSAGNSKMEARTQAVSEIFERYIKNRIIAERISLPLIPEHILDMYPKVLEAKHELEQEGFIIEIKDASLGGVYPVIAITMIEAGTGRSLVSFGAHPGFEVALDRTMTELLQGRRLDSLDGFQTPCFDDEAVADPVNLETHFIDSSGIVSWEFLRNEPDYAFSDWDGKGQNTQEEFDWLCERIHEEGNDIFIMDYEELGVYACRVLVPGMSEIYPPDDLVWENNNAGMDVREAILAKNKTEEDCEALMEKLDDLNADDQHPVAALIGLPADKDSIFSDLRIAELITLLALRVQDNERIQEGCEWLLHFRQINPQRLKTYQCINTLLQFDGMAKYGASLKKLYGKAVLNDALALIDGEDIFPLESDWKMHELLLDGYKKIQI